MIRRVNQEEFDRLLRFGKGKYITDILDFAESDLDVCECTQNGKPAYLMRNSYQILAKRLNVPVKVIQRDNRIFLLKKK